MIVPILVSSVFLVVGISIIACNWWMVVIWVRTRQVHSCVGFVGAILASAGLLFSPVSILNQYWWIPYFLDWGSIPGIVYAVVYSFCVKNRSGKE
jgi:riboflavin transporter FmnP